jgi:hypothetical protein
MRTRSRLAGSEKEEKKSSRPAAKIPPTVSNWTCAAVTPSMEIRLQVDAGLRAKQHLPFLYFVSAVTCVSFMLSSLRPTHSGDYTLKVKDGST